ncbi:uncharacterized protein A1O9_12614 [Exophiala aquamarina CBS 119918]|uniref:AMP-dependent synthetase/ligase domain-containing protein n=1 Tax=Exophiala aquamarina CBS 119918 TaxID=1182545 RepID=A0A072NTU7_9EURO|nr:uncharacterized protein A1O9_12614 [Exophiala aquamarina CBS 119918]KEF51264.1 hypothetical protein A1O9_12614 [Exophiala aquamarina CBS 119918]
MLSRNGPLPSEPRLPLAQEYVRFTIETTSSVDLDPPSSGPLEKPPQPISDSRSSHTAQSSLKATNSVLSHYKNLHDVSSARSFSTIANDKRISPTPELTINLPNKKYTRIMRNIRWTVLSVYRRLNILVLTTNIAAIAALACRKILLSMTPESAATAVSVNLSIAVLIRQELVVNGLFWLFGKCPQSFPLRIRRLAAKIYHLGGIHSGAAMGATVWFAIFNVSIVNAYQTSNLLFHREALPAITVVLDVLLISIVVMAHPAIRARTHNTFEFIHRFAGWTSLALFWVLFGLLVDARMRAEGSTVTIQSAVGGNPIFWTLLIATISVASPWIWLRKVPVNAEPLSDHAIRLHFTYTNLPLCAAPRVSDSPLLEWHAFAGIPEQDGQGFSILVSRAGDWTAKLIRNPPTKLWVRGIPTMGVLHIAPIFKKVVLVATGSGIGPVLSLLTKVKINCRILWSTPNPEATYSSSVIDNVCHADPAAIIINTSVSGRPDLVNQSYELYAKSGAEAIFIISNPRVTRTVVYGLESRGVPIFAPIFDS